MSEEKEMNEIEINIMTLLMKKGYRDKTLPDDEMNTLQKFIKKYPDEHQKILKGENPHGVLP